MSTQWEIDLILNVWFTCIRLKLSFTIHPRTLMKSKIGGKNFLKNMSKQTFITISNLVKFSLRSKNELVVLIAVKLSAALNT